MFINYFVLFSIFIVYLQLTIINGQDTEKVAQIFNKIKGLKATITNKNEESKGNELLKLTEQSLAETKKVVDKVKDSLSDVLGEFKKVDGKAKKGKKLSKYDTKNIQELTKTYTDYAENINKVFKSDKIKSLIKKLKAEKGKINKKSSDATQVEKKINDLLGDLKKTLDKFFNGHKNRDQANALKESEKKLEEGKKSPSDEKKKVQKEEFNISKIFYSFKKAYEKGKAELKKYIDGKKKSKATRAPIL